MKTIIYISGILGAILLVVSSIGIYAELPNNRFIFISSLLLLILIFLPFSIVEKYKQNKKVNDIIRSYKDKNQENKSVKHGEAKTNGWGMNNSPFRERKSGLNWGGGNVKGANAARGTRKSFFK